MNVRSRITVDTNILIYGSDATDGPKQRLSLKILRRLPLLDAFLTLQVLGEFYAASTRKNINTKQQAASRIATFRSMLNVATANTQTLDMAMEAVYQHSLSFWDAMLWATAEQAKCDYLLSEDFQHGRQLGRVTFINPFRSESEDMVQRLLGTEDV